MAIFMSGTTYIYLVVVFLALGIYKFILYPAFLSPLAKVPNAHFTAAVSPLWILWKRFRMTGNKTIHAAHVRYGPIVRLGPSEVSINCYEGGLRTVYTGGYEKHEWYPRLFGSFGTISMFSTTGSKEHSIRKRMLSNVYSKSYIQTSPQLRAVSQEILINRLFPILNDYADSKVTVEVHEFNNAIALDFITGYIFGLRAGSNFLQDPPLRKIWFSVYHSRKEFEFYHQETPGLLAWSKTLGVPLIPKWCDSANEYMESWGLEACDKADNLLSSTDPLTEPTVYKQLKQALETQLITASESEPSREDLKQLRFDVACETFDHLTAGHETSGVTLTYLCWELSKNTDIQIRLRKELKTLNPSVVPSNSGTGAKLPSANLIDSLPLLDAVIMETLRLYPPIPGIQPRVTPANVSLAKYHNLPLNTRVNAQAYSLHKNEDVFPNQAKWLPDRWIVRPGGSSELDEMKRWFWAFGSGGRMCIGRHFALQEIKFVIAAFYTNFTTSVVDDQGMEPLDAYTTRPTGNKLLLKFERASGVISDL